MGGLITLLLGLDHEPGHGCPQCQGRAVLLPHRDRGIRTLRSWEGGRWESCGSTARPSSGAAAPTPLLPPRLPTPARADPALLPIADFTHASQAGLPRT